MKGNKDLILKDLKGILSTRFLDNLKDLILFGSQLSDSATDDSDYDILIILKKTADWRIEREISDLCYEIDLKYGIITDTHVISEEELKSSRGKQPIFINAISNGYRA
jgi:predicted nucleotidyltransferase